MGLGWGENDEKEKKRVRLRMELSGGWGSRMEKWLVGGGGGRPGRVEVGMRTMKAARVWGLVRSPGSFRRSPRGPLGGRRILPGTSPSSSQVRAFGRKHPSGPRKEMHAERAGRGEGSDQAGLRTRGPATRGEGRRGPRARAGPEAGRAGPGRAWTDCHADGLTAA